MAAEAEFVIRPQPSGKVTWNVSFQQFFTAGGFHVCQDVINIQNRWGARNSIPRSSVCEVVLASTRWQLRAGAISEPRILLLDRNRHVTAREIGWFYPESEVRRLSDGLGVPLHIESFDGPAKLDESYPGALRYRWERHPRRTGALLAPALILILILTLLIMLFAAASGK